MQAEKAIVQGITRALKYAFPPNQLKNCGPKLEVDEYKRLFSDMEKAREFLMSLPFLGKCCAKIAAYKGLDTFDSRVVDAYFLGIDPFVDNNRPITHLMNRLLTDGTIIHKARSTETKIYFISKLNSCVVRCGTVISSKGYNVVADMHMLVLKDGKIQPTTGREILCPLPFDGQSFKPGEAVAAHGYYMIERLPQHLLSMVNGEAAKEVEMFNSKSL